MTRARGMFAAFKSMNKARFLFACVLGIAVRSPLVAAERTVLEPNRREGGTTLPVIEDKGRLALDSVEQARFSFSGVLGDRIDAGVEHWLLPAPHANPGMLEMFRLRDRQPAPKLVPWAGEFVGKYLISAIQTLRLTSNPALRKQVASLVRELIACQADDGYLGPFPAAIRLKGNWDLWGHYHCIQALMMWYETTGETAALTACRRAADLICRTFLDQPLRVYDAGSPEMNMAILHGLGRLYRFTGDSRYLKMAREIEKDWERTGDYLRAGLAGLEFFQSPRPRWESLHDLQGLLELYRITGEEKYRVAFEHHWRSIARWDRHNNGAFSSGEQATGNPYAPGAIETCCTVAWMALTIDMLRLTGDPLVADELELSTFNGAAGAQHPSGRWCTYNTPMDGAREASAHSIVFQSRAGTPELNCCSVNGPRAFGMLTEWAVMSDADGLVVNYYGPGQFLGVLRDRTPVKLQWQTEYPVSGKVKVVVEPSRPRQFKLRFRIPAWSSTTTVRLNNGRAEKVERGRYLEFDRRWRKGDSVELDFDMGLRFVTGAREAAGKVSVYRGPLLLAYDQRYNEFDEDSIPILDLKRLIETTRVASRTKETSDDTFLAPWLLIDVKTGDNRAVRLCDFASAGAAGTRYRSWLVAEHSPPPPVVTRIPADGEAIPLTRSLLRWTGPRRTNATVSGYRLVISESREFSAPKIDIGQIAENRFFLDEIDKQKLSPDRWYYWKIVSSNEYGATESASPAARFKIDRSKALAPDDVSIGNQEGPDGILVKAALSGDPKPEFGHLRSVNGFKPAQAWDGRPAGAVELDGLSQMLTYAISEFPEEDYTLAIRVNLARLPENRVGQIFSAWTAPMDDPLRVCVEKGRLFARIESGQSYSTEGFPVTPDRWYHIAVVKAASQLVLYVDGERRGATTVPTFIHSMARDFGLGGNPHYAGNEFLAARFADLRLYARALSAAETAALASADK